MNSEELKKLIKELYLEEDSKKLKNFNRSLPFSDSMLNDRWERAERLGFGEGTSIYNSAIVFGDVEVGKNTWIGPNVILDGSGGQLKIGNNCSIAAGVHIYTHDSVHWAISGGKEPYRKGSVYIADNTYIGAQSILVPGIEIGSQVIIGANSNVNCSLKNKTINAGNPVKQIGTIFIESGRVKLNYE